MRSGHRPPAPFGVKVFAPRRIGPRLLNRALWVVWSESSSGNELIHLQDERDLAVPGVRSSEPRRENVRGVRCCCALRRTTADGGKDAATERCRTGAYTGAPDSAPARATGIADT
jgi:hypothetical protein